MLFPVLLLAVAGFGDQGDTTRVSVSSAGVEGNAGSYTPAVSADGRLTAFQSDATNLVPGDTNGYPDIFVRDRDAGTTVRVSVGTLGEQANGDCWEPAFSGDGRFVAFSSRASTLVPGDTNGTWDVFIRDLSGGTTERVSVSSGGVEANHFSFSPSVSDDGRFVTFISPASNLVSGDTNGVKDVFVRDRLLGVTVRVSVSSSGAQGSAQTTIGRISGDGRFVAMISYAPLTSHGTGGLAQAYLHNRQTGETRLLSVSPTDEAADAACDEPAISANGRYVAFETAATNLATGDTNGVPDIYVADTTTGAVERVSLSDGGAELTGSSSSPRLSADGRFVGFWSAASDAVVGDGNGVADAFVRDRSEETTIRVSVDSSGVEGNAASREAVLTADGRLAFFQSGASNLVAGDTNGAADVFVREVGALGGIDGLIDFDLPEATPLPSQVVFRLVWSGWDEPYAFVTAAVGVGGSYSLAVAEGEQTVSLKPSHWLRQTRLAAVGGQVSLDFALVNGDAEPDNEVNLSDVNAVLLAFGRPDALADLDHSGQADLPDLNIALVRFGLTGDP